MLDYEAALALLCEESLIKPVVVNKNIVQAHYHVLAEACYANYDSPQFDNSAMDGYALCDPSGVQDQFTVVARIIAGDCGEDYALTEGQAARIFTGAPIPKNTTTVVMQEQVRLDDDGRIYLNKPCALRQNIRYQAEEIRAGAELLPQGHRLDPAAIALLASQGVVTVKVFEAPKVAVFSTGNELVEPDVVLTPGKIYDANRYQLTAWLAPNFKVIDGGILSDDCAATKAALAAAALEHQVIILSGGASVGEEDHVKQAIGALGELTAWKLAIKPGKPFGWGRIGNCAVFMLPGNPVATFVTYYLLVYPVLLRALGKKAQLPMLNARAHFTKTKLEPRREFLRGTFYQSTSGGYQVDLVKAQGSAMLTGLSLANCLVEILPNTPIEVDTMVRIFPLP